MSQPSHSPILGTTIWGLALAALLGIFVGQGLFTVHYARGTSYLSDEPEACANCHIMRDQYDAWQRSSHGRVAVCNDCHTPHTFPDKWVVKGINGFNHSLAFTLGNFHEPIRIRPFNLRVAQNNCEDCHRTLVSQITGPHADEPLTCIACHGSVGHRTRD